MNKVFITGAAGFIGFHLARRLLDEGKNVIAIDNLNDYYDPNLKESRLSILNEYSNFKFFRYDLTEKEKLSRIFNEFEFDIVVHLAAQAGVRYSITNPEIYISSNIVGFFNVIEVVRHYDIKHFIYASSSSVYGGNKNLPFSTNDKVDHPISLYAATKKSNELIAHTYSHLYGIPSTGLRFFTVYGPWGRPDMALYKFADSIMKGKPIDIYNYGKMTRDFTYIDDIIEGIIRIMPKVPEKGDMLASPYKIYNIGSNNPVNLMDYIDCLERYLDKPIEKNYLDMQPGDVKDTYADVTDLVHAINFSPQTSINDGVSKFVEWFKSYHNK